MQDTLIFYRTILDEWIKESKDFGSIPERELIAQWLPDGVAKRLPPLEVAMKDSVVQLISPQRDATIVWKHPQDSIWKIYVKPLSKDLNFEAKAERIGYMDSEILRME